MNLKTAVTSLTYAPRFFLKNRPLTQIAKEQLKSGSMSCFLEETTLEFPSKSGMLAVANVKNLSDQLPESLSVL